MRGLDHKQKRQCSEDESENRRNSQDERTRIEPLSLL
jgi:hypothetical protein